MCLGLNCFIRIEIKLFSYSLRKNSKTFDPRHVWFPIWKTQRGPILQTSSTLRIEECAAMRKVWRVGEALAAMPFSWEVWRTHTLDHKAGSFSPHPCSAWDTCISIAPVLPLCTSVSSHSSPFSPWNHLLQCPPWDRHREGAEGKLDGWIN